MTDARTYIYSGSDVSGRKTLLTQQPTARRTGMESPSNVPHAKTSSRAFRSTAAAVLAGAAVTLAIQSMGYAAPCGPYSDCDATEWSPLDPSVQLSQAHEPSSPGASPTSPLDDLERVDGLLHQGDLVTLRKELLRWDVETVPIDSTVAVLLAVRPIRDQVEPYKLLIDRLEPVLVAADGEDDAAETLMHLRG